MVDDQNNNPPANPPVENTPPSQPPVDGGDGGDNNQNPPTKDTPLEKTPSERETALEAENQTLKDELAGKKDVPPQQPPTQDTTPQQPPVSQDGPIDAKIYAVLLNKGYSESELSFIEKAAKLELGKPLKEVIESDFVKNGIASMRSKDESQQAPSTPTGRVPMSSDGKSLRETPKEDRGKEFSFEAWKRRQK